MTTQLESQAAAPAARSAGHISQATAVEQARAVAEVQAAIIVAQQCPRSVPTAVTAMRESCAQTGLAERAFFRYNRAGNQITGPSVHLARELARCWGNMQYGIAELRRDDVKGESEMLAFAWDVQTNTRATTTFVVKNLRDTTKGAKILTDQRDIYENNANMGARRLREQIFAILPTWFTEQAKDLCDETLKSDGGSGKPLPTRIADAVKAFAGKGVSLAQLEDKLGRKSADWVEHDVAQLLVVFKSLDRGETTIEDEFATARVTGAEIIGQRSGGAPAAKSARAHATPPPPSTAMDTTEPTQAEIDAMTAEMS